MISDIAENTKMGEYLNDFVPCLHSILCSEAIDKWVKPYAFSALGDLANYCDQFVPLKLDETLAVMAQAARLSIQVSDQNPETLTYLRELRENLIDQYIVFIYAA